MRISIWDLDWYYKFSQIPNFKAQKISSYHKQKEDLINFIETAEHIFLDYDIMYIFKEKKITPMPPSKFIDRVDTKLVGKLFDYYDNYFQLTPVMKMVRPDYLLYNVPEKNKFANATVIQLLDGLKFLPKTQNAINERTKFKNKTLFVDDKIWNLETNNIEKYLSIVKQYNNVAFLNQIELKSLMKPEIKKSFLEINFSVNTQFRFRNNYGSTFEEVKEIVDFLKKLKDKNPSIAISPFPVKSILFNHWKDESKGIEDFKRLLKIMDYAKKNKIKVIIKNAIDRLATPYWAFFDIFEMWSTYYYHNSYIETMLYSRIKKTNEQWHEILNNKKKWSTPRIDLLLYLINTYPDIIFKYGAREWGNKCLDLKWIDLEEIKKASYIYKQKETLIKIEKALEEA